MTTETSPMPNADHWRSPVPRPGGETRDRALYWRLWGAFPRDIGYLALTGVIVLVLGGAWALVGSWVSGSGLFDLILLALALLGLLWFGRVFAVVETARLAWARQPAPRPFAWREATSVNRLVRILEVARDPHAWLHAAFTAIAFPVVGFVTACVTAGSMLLAAVGLIGGPFVTVFGWNGYLPGSFDWRVVFGVPVFIASLGLVALLPFIAHGGVLAHEAIARLMLSAFPTERLRAEVEGLEVSRSAAVSAEGTALRRLERDIHDGPQQRLIRMQMDLAAASRAADSDTARSKALIEEALAQSREALEELRALSRGFAPPLLLDRGLAAALEAVVDRATVSTRFTDELSKGAVLPLEIERNAYFIAAELLANVAKHARATRAELILTTPPDELVVVVTDDGVGGASVQQDHGLAGIEERLTGLGGRLELRSPLGGPTHVRVSIPMSTQPAPETDAGETLPVEIPVAETTPVEPLAATLPFPTEELPRVGAESSDAPPAQPRPAPRRRTRPTA